MTINRGLHTFNQPHYVIYRFTGQCLNFNCVFILVLMLRQSITFLRSRGFSLVLPLDRNIYFHKQAGYLIVFYSALHTIMHCFNLGNYQRCLLVRTLWLIGRLDNSRRDFAEKCQIYKRERYRRMLVETYSNVHSYGFLIHIKTWIWGTNSWCSFPNRNSTYAYTYCNVYMLAAFCKEGWKFSGTYFELHNKN